MRNALLTICFVSPSSLFFVPWNLKNDGQGRVFVFGNSTSLSGIPDWTLMREPGVLKEQNLSHNVSEDSIRCSDHKVVSVATSVMLYFCSCPRASRLSWVDQWAWFEVRILTRIRLILWISSDQLPDSWLFPRHLSERSPSYRYK